MPRRKTPLVNGEIYHVFNRSTADAQIFHRPQDIDRFLNLVNYYRFETNTMKFSYFKRLIPRAKQKYLDSLYLSQPIVDILSFCVMPNHYHFLAKQKMEKGIQRFVSLVQNGYAKFYNNRFDRHGALFQSPFKAIIIANEEQLLHVSRYIHLNPFSSNLIPNIHDLENTPTTSLKDLVSSNPRKFINTEILGFFKSKRDFMDFVYNRADYQKSLQILKRDYHTPGV